MFIGAGPGLNFPGAARLHSFFPSTLNNLRCCFGHCHFHRYLFVFKYCIFFFMAIHTIQSFNLSSAKFHIYFVDRQHESTCA